MSRPGRSSVARRRRSGWKNRRPSPPRNRRSLCSTCQWPAGDVEREGGAGRKEEKDKAGRRKGRKERRKKIRRNANDEVEKGNVGKQKVKE